MDMSIISRLFHESATSITRELLQGRYCSVVGPRQTGKTTLALLVKEQILGIDLYQGKAIVCYFDIAEHSSASKSNFYIKLAHLLSNEFVLESVEISNQLEPDRVISSTMFRHFLLGLVQSSNRRVFLIIDHLEAVPQFIAKSLLECLRSVYSERNVEKHYRMLSVLAVGTLAIDKMTTDQTSPFSANKYIFQSISSENVQLVLSKFQDIFTSEAIERVISTVDGDLFLLSEILRNSERYVSRREAQTVSGDDIDTIIQSYVNRTFPKTEVFTWAVGLIEQETSALEAIARILLGEEVKLASRPMESNLELSGLVKRQGNDTYTWRNPVYELAVRQYYTPGKLAKVWFNTDRIDLAGRYAAPNLNLDDDLKECITFLRASLSVVRESVTIANAATHIINSIKSTVGGRQIVVWVTNKNVNRVTDVYTDANQSIDGLDVTIGKLKTDNRNHNAIVKALVKGRPHFECNNGRNVMTTFPIIYNGERFGAIQIFDLFAEDQYWKKVKMIQVLELYALATAKSLFQIDSIEKDVRMLRYWQLSTALLGISFLGSNFSRFLNYFSNQQFVFSKNILLAFNSCLLLTVLLSILIVVYRKIPNDLIKYSLTIVTFVAGVLVTALTPNGVSEMLSSWITLGFLSFLQVVSGVLIFKMSKRISI